MQSTTISEIQSLIDSPKAAIEPLQLNLGRTVDAESLAAYHSAIIDSSEDAIISKNLNSIITSWNKAAEEIFGYTADEAIGRSLAIIIPPGRWSEEVAIISKIKRGERIHHFQTVRRRKDGRLIDISVSISPIKNSKGVVIGAAKIARDITQQVRLENEHRQLAEVVASSDDAIISLDREGIILSWNKGAEKLYGYTASEMLGKEVSELIPPESQNDFSMIMDRLLEGKKIEHYETKRLAKSGKLLEVSLTVSPLRDEYGEIIGASKIGRDITEQKRLERQRDDFIGIATHELKTPVTSIKAYGQVLKEIFKKQADTRAVAYLEKMDAQLNKLTVLIADLLDVSKIQNNRLNFNHEPFEISALVKEINEELQRTTDRHRLVLELDKPTEIIGDRDRLGQVLTNLISNAIKYSPHSDKIITKLSIKEREIQISVQDFGVGIPKDKQDRIFEKFFRVSGPKQETFPGMGVGLYISAEIVKRLGGKIWLKSEPGVGSTFYFTIPRHVW